MKLGCVVMAAGNARRFGENKLAARFRGKSLIQRTLEAVPDEVFDTVAVVCIQSHGMESTAFNWDAL